MLQNSFPLHLSRWQGILRASGRYLYTVLDRVGTPETRPSRQSHLSPYTSFLLLALYSVTLYSVWSFPNTTWYTKQPEFSLNHLLSHGYQHYQKSVSQPVFLLIIRSSITHHHLCEDHQHQVKMGENNHHSRYIIHSIHYHKNSNPINISEKRKNSGWLLSGNRVSAIVSETAAHVRNFFLSFY